MRRRVSHPDSLLTWAAALSFALAAAWPLLTSRSLPLLGLRALTDPRLGWPLVAGTAALAAFLSVPRWNTRSGVKAGAAIAACLFLVTAIFIAPAASIFFALLTGNLVRDLRSRKPDEAPLP
jgi:peptidoglycan/LPS O-acetylase OafA/YrhL